VVTEGEAILRYKNKLIESLLKRTHEIEINGMKVKAINSPVLQSELGTRLAEENDFGVVWYQASDTEVRFSLRSLDSKEDVSKIAESFPPGGGHRCASGFALKENLLKDKIK
jgi:oligoribonuclease NrnB/cAMP/cGMP phosphodiesterase (DHH superfamily)